MVTIGEARLWFSLAEYSVVRQRYSPVLWGYGIAQSGSAPQRRSEVTYGVAEV